MTTTYVVNAAVAQHLTVGLVAGDDWQIDITLQSSVNTPIDLTGATMTWCLLSSVYTRVMDMTDVTLTVTDAINGKVRVNVPAAKSTKLPSGFYTDTLRMVKNAVTTTMLFGQLNVMADPWAAVAAPVTGSIVPFQRTMERNRRELERQPA